jgi:hypothetical protein
MLYNKKVLFGGNRFSLVYDNDVDAFIPELWANESLALLTENMIAGSLVYRDFENVLQSYGDVVNVRRPGEFTAKRKTNADNVVIQDAIATNIQVPLNQHIHTSFLIRDGEESKAFKDLVDEFLRPAIIAQARFIDQVVLGQYPQFLNNGAGGLGALDATNAKTSLLGLRQVMNQNRSPMEDRNLILNPVSETTLLGLDLFIAANQVGDMGQALQNASLGRKLGFNMFMDQNMPVVTAGVNTATNGAINNAAGYPVGSTVLTVDGYTGAVGTGSYVWIGGNPYRVTAHTETTGNTTSITLDRGLVAAVADNAVVYGYTAGAVNNSTGYPVGYAKEITIDGFTVAPQVGQAITFGTTAGSAIYTVLAVNGLVGITLDRPLEAAIANNDPVNLGPAGAFNFAFHRNAMALVVRPLAKPKAGTGALSAVVNWNDLSMRAVITYDGEKQGHLVTIDMLAGIAVLDRHLGAVLLA